MPSGRVRKRSGGKPGHEERRYPWFRLSRWNHDRFFDPRTRITDQDLLPGGRLRGLFRSHGMSWGFPHKIFRTMTSATRTTLWLAQRAIQASGISSRYPA